MRKSDFNNGGSRYGNNTGREQTVSIFKRNDTWLLN